MLAGVMAATEAVKWIFLHPKQTVYLGVEGIKDAPKLIHSCRLQAQAWKTCVISQFDEGLERCDVKSLSHNN